MSLLQIQKRKMALAGTIMSLFLVFHMLANLTLLWPFSAQQFYDWYQQPWIRWPVFSVFIISLLLHVRIAITIRKRNARARLTPYQKQDKFHIPATLVTISITLLLLFILFHLYQSLTLHTGNIQAQVKSWFASPITTLIYLAGIVILTLHLMHSLTNVLQTLGLSSKTYLGLIATSVGSIFIGFVSVPVYFFWSM